MREGGERNKPTQGLNVSATAPHMEPKVHLIKAADFEFCFMKLPGRPRRPCIYSVVAPPGQLGKGGGSGARLVRTRSGTHRGKDMGGTLKPIPAGDWSWGP